MKKGRHMRIIKSNELKQIELDILTKIDYVCRKNNFRYSLCGGTLLGAIRHKGYIPWDDDIDIAMPRDDYDKFLNYCMLTVACVWMKRAMSSLATIFCTSTAAT